MISTTWFLFSFWLKQFLGYDSTQLKFISDYFNQISGVLGYKIWVISFCSLEWSKEQAFLFIAWPFDWEVALHDQNYWTKNFHRPSQIRFFNKSPTSVFITNIRIPHHAIQYRIAFHRSRGRRSVSASRSPTSQINVPHNVIQRSFQL